MAQATNNQAKQAIFELKYYYLRNTPDNMRGRTPDFLRTAHVPALKRAGSGPVLAYSSNIAPHSPFVLTVTQWPSLAAMETGLDKMAADGAYQQALTAYSNGPGVPFVRTESALLKAFSAIPQIELSRPKQANARRLFELRTYESNSPVSLARKVRMFNEGEIALFREVEMVPVFFGETIVGGNAPNLTYLLAYDDMAMRERVWKSFVTSPKWKEMSSPADVQDAQIVSNISASFLSPLPFSDVL